MGMKRCQFCGQESGSYHFDVTLEGGVQYQIPALIVHFIEAHGYCPPRQFCEDILSKQVTAYAFHQTRGIKSAPIQVGFLPGDYPTDPDTVPQGVLPQGVLERIKEMVAESKQRRYSQFGGTSRVE